MLIRKIAIALVVLALMLAVPVSAGWFEKCTSVPSHLVTTRSCGSPLDSCPGNCTYTMRPAEDLCQGTLVPSKCKQSWVSGVQMQYVTGCSVYQPKEGAPSCVCNPQNVVTPTRNVPTSLGTC